MKSLVVSFFLICSCSVLGKSLGKPARLRGVDFRMQINLSRLNYTDISGIQRDFNGFGAELSSHLYLFESGFVNSNFFLSTRLMNYTGLETQIGERDDIQGFSGAPGLEVNLGALYVRGAYQVMKLNNYFVSTNSLERHYTVSTPSLAAGFNFRLGHLGLGIGATWIKAPVSYETLGLPSTTSSVFDETAYSINLIYYIGKPKAKFVKDLFE